MAHQAARIGTFESHVQTGVNTWTPELEAMYGLPPRTFEGTLSAFEKLVHPDDLPEVVRLFHETSKGGQPMEGEWRVVWPDKSVHWIAGRWQLFMNEAGEPSRMIGVNMDVTQSKEAQSALAGMTRKLIEAQELERSRIGRELHDDISQRLAMLSIKLEQLQSNPCEVGSSLQKMRTEVVDICSDVQALSHELHSSKLEYLGVVAGRKSWCREFAERHRMEIDFSSDARTSLPLEIGMTLLRVLQEGLQNAKNHSGVKRVEVQLREDSGAIHLVVTDLGKGFQLRNALRGKGLGLASMRERVRLVNGTIAIDSKPMAGTTIHIKLPLTARSESARVAG